MGDKKVWPCRYCEEQFRSAARLAEHQAAECVKRLEALVAEGKIDRG